MASIGQLHSLSQVSSSGPLGVLKLQELLHLGLTVCGEYGLAQAQIQQVFLDHLDCL
jgi:hypothetical protein